jgi:hypothetical protein
MKGVLIRVLAASSAAVLWSTRALAQSEPPLEYQPPPPPPPEVRPRPRPPTTTVVVTPEPPRDVITWQEQVPNANLVGSGLLTLGLSYGTSVVVGATSDRASDQFLFVPLAGPWMDLATRDCRGAPCDLDEVGNRVLLVANGIVQAAGALEILAGFAMPVTRTVTRVAQVPKGVHVTPTAGPGAVGLAAYGAF